MVSTRKNVSDLFAGVMDRGQCLLGCRQFFLEKNRRKYDFGPLDSKVVSTIEHGTPDMRKGILQPVCGILVIGALVRIEPTASLMPRNYPIEYSLTAKNL